MFKKNIQGVLPRQDELVFGNSGEELTFELAVRISFAFIEVILNKNVVRNRVDKRQWLEAMAEYLKLDPGIVNQPDKEGNTCLGYAVKARDEVLCDFLFKHGADPFVSFRDTGVIKTKSLMEIAEKKQDSVSVFFNNILEGFFI